MLKPGDFLEHQPDCVWSRVDDEVVVLSASASTVTVLSEVAGAIWQRVDGRTPLEEIARALSVDYEVDFDTALADALGFAAELVAGDLLRLVPAGGG